MTIDYADLIGVPFVYNGRDASSALDCYGLVKELHRRRGVELPDYHTPKGDAPTIAAIMAAGKVLWRPTELQPGSVMLMRLGRYYWHVATYLGDDEFIHTSEMTGGVCVERLHTWINRIEGYYEYAGTPQP